MLESEGANDFCEVIDSSSDRDHVPGESKGSDENAKGDETSTASRMDRSDVEDVMSGSEVEVSMLQGRSLSWKTCNNSSDSSEKRKEYQRRQRHVRGLVSRVESPSQHLLGKSCRRIKSVRDMGNTSENGRSRTTKWDHTSDCGDDEGHLSMETYDIEREKPGENVFQPSEDQNGGSVVDLYADRFNRDDEEMEKALRQQAQLIGQFQAKEIAQREWEEKYNENNSSALTERRARIQNRRLEKCAEKVAEKTCPLLPTPSTGSHFGHGVTGTHLDIASGSSALCCKIPPLEKWQRRSFHGDGVCANNGSQCSLSPATVIKGCDVYVGLCRGDRRLFRFVKWLRAELESHGVQCFASDRSSCPDTCAHSLAREAMDSATIGLLVITKKTFSSFYGMEELSFFLGRNNLVPIFFGLRQECLVRNITERRGELWKKYGGSLWEVYGGFEQEWSEAMDKLSRLECKLEALGSDLRECILDSIILVGRRLGRRGIVEKVRRWKEIAANVEHPFPRNNNFVGRKQELRELELMLFGYAQGDEPFHVDVRRRHGRGLLTSKTIDRLLQDQKDKLVESTQGKDLDNEAEKEGDYIDELTYCFPGLARNVSSMKELYGKGVACVCGDSGIGKTELLLEFTYKVSHRYKMVLWIGGETKYFRLNYLNLLFFLGVDASNESEAYLECSGPKSFKDAEEQAIRRVRKELMRDIPFLLVIDNLESEKDWWDGKNLMEVLPHLGGETHVIISTRMSKVLNLQPMWLSYLSHTEALLLMKVGLRDFSEDEIEALDVSEQKLGRLPLGLAIFGAMLSEIPIGPKRLLNAMERMQHVDCIWNDEDHFSQKYPYIIQLLNLCLIISDVADKNKNLASRMVQASGWFAPSPIPIDLLLTAASEIVPENHCIQSWKKFSDLVTCMCVLSPSKLTEVDASSILFKLQIARITTKDGSIYFHDIIRNYARKKGRHTVAHAMVRAISRKGDLHHHVEHVWAASFLLFKLDTNQPTVSLSVQELVAFISKFVLPLARDTFSSLSRCEAASKLLFVSEELLKDLENSYILEESDAAKNCFCSRPLKNHSTTQFDPHIYKEFALLRAAILETRAMMMLRGGHYDIAERLCRSAINIKEVFYGCEHSKTAFTREIMDRLVRIQSKF